MFEEELNNPELISQKRQGETTANELELPDFTENNVWDVNQSKFRQIQI